MHGPTKIPGELRFSLDIRSEDKAVLDAAAALLAARAESIAAQRDVTLSYGAGMRVEPLRMAPWLRAALNAGAATAKVPVLEMASGAGHDALIFGQQDVDCAMLFIRNTGGSHNPDEAMDLADFNAALAVLLAALPKICAA
jgi:N-carbamoyl-L-amino-acid hydrolase